MHSHGDHGNETDLKNEWIPAFASMTNCGHSCEGGNPYIINNVTRALEKQLDFEHMSEKSSVAVCECDAFLWLPFFTKKKGINNRRYFFLCNL